MPDSSAAPDAHTYATGWVVPGTLFAASVGGLYLRFLWSLPARTRYLILAAGGIFLCGALGVEAITARYVEENGFANLTYAGLATVEEFFEMAGASLFLYALLSYLRERTTEPHAHRQAALRATARSSAER